MSSKSSMAVPKCLPFLCLPVVKDSLHLVEHVAEGGLELERFLDFLRAHIRILTIFEEAGALMIADELDEGGCIRLPIFREAFEILKDCVQAGAGEDCHRVFGVFIEIGVEDSHVLEVSVPFDFKEVPTQIVES